MLEALNSRAGKIILLIIGGGVVLGLGVGYAIGWATQPVDRPLGAPTVMVLDWQGPNNVPRYKDVYVNDFADILSPKTEETVREYLIGLFDRSGIEASVLTVPRMGDYGDWTDIEDFGRAVFDGWGIGDAERNDGLLITIAVLDREMWVTPGAGVSVSKDPSIQYIVDRNFLPQFKNGGYDEGVISGTAALVELVGDIHPDDVDRPPLSRGWSVILRWIFNIQQVLVVLVSIPAMLAMWLARGRYLSGKYGRARRKPCPKCTTAMTMIDDRLDDEHLDGGQRLEEHLASVDHQVWDCHACHHMTIESVRNPARSRQYKLCPECDYTTLEVERHIEVSATEAHEGLIQLLYDCENCGYMAAESLRIPKLVTSALDISALGFSLGRVSSETSNNNRSGRSRTRFGGGKSRRGGSGGSW